MRVCMNNNIRQERIPLGHGHEPFNKAEEAYNTALLETVVFLNI